MTIKNKIIFLFVLITAIPTLAGVFWGFRVFHRDIEIRMIEQLDSISESESVHFSQLIQTNLRLVNSITSRTELTADLDQYIRGQNNALKISSLNQQLVDIVKNEHDVTSVQIFSALGAEVANVGHKKSIEQLSDYENKTLRSPSPSLGKFFLNEDNILQYSFLGPIWRENEFLGTLLIVFDAEKLFSLRNVLPLMTTDEISLIDLRNEQEIIVHPLRLNERALLKNASELFPSENVQSIFSDESEKLRQTAIDYRGEEVFFSLSKIELPSLAILIKIDRDEVIRGLLSFENTVYFIWGALYVLILLIWYLTSGRLINDPITKLMDSANSVMNGDLTTHVTLDRSDEFGKLGDSFNQMTSKLRNLYGNLEQKVEERTKQLNRVLEETKGKNSELDDTQTALVNVLEDIDEQKSNIENAKALDDAILASLGEGLLVVNNQEDIVLANDAAIELLGDTNLVGTKILSVLKLSTEKSGVLKKDDNPIIQSFASGKPFRIGLSDELYIQTKRKSRFPVEMNISPMVIDDVITGLVLVFSDITAEVESERPKKEFVSLASHQLRTPVSSINWYLELFADEGLDKISDEQKSYLDEVKSASQRMIQLITALLNVSRLELGTFAINPEQIDTQDYLETLLHELEPSAAIKEVDLKLIVKKILPSMLADKQLLRIVVENLVSNAIKYSPESSTVEVKVEEVSKQTQYKDQIIPEDGIVILVQDHGFGIPKHQQAKIFEKLFRADNVREKNIEGTGLGLYMVKNIVEQISGFIWFESVEDEGTRFYVYLPLAGMTKAKEGKTLETS
jgi:signal transduction histidine kinase